MARQKTKDLTPVSFRLDSEVVENLNEYSEQTMIPKTRLVETAMREFLAKHRGA